MGNLYDQEGNEVEVVDVSQEKDWSGYPPEELVSRMVDQTQLLEGDTRAEAGYSEDVDIYAEPFYSAAVPEEDKPEVDEWRLSELLLRLAYGQQPPYDHMSGFTTWSPAEEPEEGPSLIEQGMRAFDTGATRNVEVDPDLYGFTSPLALAMFAKYMHENRTQADGTIRDSDNWKQGIPLDSYIRSMRRHLQDLTMHHDGYGNLAREDLDAALAGLFFNVQGYMHEVARADIDKEDA